jgi:pyruvate kinase
LDALIAAGMNVARMNFSHGTHTDHARRIADVRAAAARAHRPIAILQDLQGPKIRTGALIGGQSVHLEPGTQMIITIDPSKGLRHAYLQPIHTCRRMWQSAIIFW